ncbi:MAG: TIGR02285 family protein [Desulfobacula sp.]|uniref:TIGR02285 family protein n=1 Tax=Desulfobacula sp. TaxID=2593537 RepID=UPI0025B81EFE|nr:TIGR02285 family protein [Desulfobacula sp.]MCD4722619.1 TIGR02285 family protein [Desulfobacula sp.]
MKTFSFSMRATFSSTVTAIFFLLCSSSGYASDIVVWAVADRPTSYILEGQDKGRGVVDEVYSIFHENLNDYDHKTKDMNFARILVQMEHGKNLCACGFKKPEREKVGYFSIPAIIALPFSVVAKKGRLNEIYGNTKSISLKNLFENINLEGGVTKKRSYGDITMLIDEYEKKGNLYVQSSTHNLMKMLIANRLDYAIEIPSFAKYIAKQLRSEEIIESYAIEENKNKVLVAHIFCTKNEWGHAIIKRIDNILRKERNSSGYIEILERWYDEKGRRIIREYYNTNFLKSEH